MAIDITKLVKKGAQDIHDDLLAADIRMEQFTYTGYTGDVANSQTLQLIKPQRLADTDANANRPNTIPANLGRNPSWPAARGVGQDSKDVSVNVGLADVVDIGITDLREADYDVTAQANADIAERIRYLLNQRIAKEFLDNVPNANKSTLGSATEYIPESGKPVTASKSADASSYNYFIESFLEAAGWMVSNNMLATGEQSRELFCIMPGYLWMSIPWYAYANESTDMIWNTLIAPGSNLPLRQNAGPQQQGIQIHLWNEMPTVEESSKTHGQILFGTNRAVAFAARPPIYNIDPPTSGTTGAIGWSAGYYLEGFCHSVNPDQTRLVKVRQEA